MYATSPGFQLDGLLLWLLARFQIKLLQIKRPAEGLSVGPLLLLLLSEVVF